MNSVFKLVLFGNSINKILFTKNWFIKGNVCSVISQILTKNIKILNVLSPPNQVDKCLSVQDNYAIEKNCLEED